MQPRNSALPLSLALGVCLLHSATAISICVVHDPPFTSCPSPEFEGFVQEEDTIRGLDVELLRWVLINQGFSWDPDAGYADPKYKKYSWRCSPQMTWATVTATAVRVNMSSGPWPPVEQPPPAPSPPPVAEPPLPAESILAAAQLPFPCDISVGDMTFVSKSYGTTSVPYYETGAGILTLSSGSVKDPWAFVRPFHWSLWVAFLASIVIIPATVFFVERLSTDGKVMMNRHGFSQWRMAQYKTFLGIFNLQVYSVVSWPAQVNIIAFCFLVLIVIQTYNAQLGALFTDAAQSSAINSVQDLGGKKVGTLNWYAQLLQERYPKLVMVPYSANNTDEIFSLARDALDSGEVSAFIYDVAPFVYRLASLPDPCKYRMITDPLPYKFTYAFLMNLQWNRTQIVKDFYYSMLRARETYIDQELQEKYIGSLPSCKGLASKNGITFMQMSGLFIVVGAVTVATLLSGLVTMAVRIYQHMDDEEGSEDGKVAASWMSCFGGSRRRKSMSKKSVGAALTRVFTRTSYAPPPSQSGTPECHGPPGPAARVAPESPAGGSGGGRAPLAMHSTASLSRFTAGDWAATATVAACDMRRKSALSMPLRGAQSLQCGLSMTPASPTSQATSPEPQEPRHGSAISSLTLEENRGQVQRVHVDRPASPSCIQLQLVASLEDGAPAASSSGSGGA